MSTTLEERLRYIKQEKDTKLTASNIRAGVTVLNITGNLIESAEEENVVVDPSITVLEIEPNIGYTGLKNVTINAVTANISPNIVSRKH